ncbi:restriction endonuclease subunit S [Vibrio cholerae]|nr:restriction endonuclease subunit S [Vibrio cholerae]EJL6408681.1 restriction endonuclease subunit S [Vibrio cholerae]EJL6709089.1 restriction endonuclease subunit S [Vibrio cholerae]EKF9878604.1 restriction endonuclease subunit S [Vibrio cholerae]
MNLRSTDSMSVEALQSKGSSFKNTEVGRVPTDWEVVCLREVANFGGGTTPPRKNFEKFYASGTHPWVKTLDLNNGYISSTEENVTGAAFSETSLKMHPIGTVLVAMYGGFNQIGRTGLIQVGAAINQALVAVITKKERLVPTYLINYLNYKVDYWKTVASSSRKDPNITSNDVKNFMLPLPSVIEQTAIANALSDVDALIQELEKLIAKKQAIKTATMQQLLTGHTRLPQFAHHPDGRKKGYKPSELGEIPEDWEVLSLGTASSFTNGRAYALHEWETAGTPVIRLQNLTGRGEDYYYSNMQLPERQYCQEGDLLFMWSATFGPVIWKGPKAIYHYHIWKIICNSGFSQVFMLHLLDDMTEKLKSGSSSGGTMLHVTKHKMETTKAVFPVFQEQAAIGTLLDDMDEEIRALENRLNKTRQIKQGMMQELLTGKTRLVKPAGAA